MLTGVNFPIIVKNDLSAVAEALFFSSLTFALPFRCRSFGEDRAEDGCF
jgi:hypothetical protein